MDIQKERKDFEAVTNTYHCIYNAGLNYYFSGSKFAGDKAEIEVNAGWKAWQAKAQAVPEGFILVKKRNLIGNPNVDFLQAPRWAKYWLMDGHSKKYWWSSVRPKKDMDLLCYAWGGQHFVREAPSFGFAGPWNESLTSKKAMLEAQEPAND